MSDHEYLSKYKKFRYFVELTNQGLQIIAILIAALWAYWTWEKTSAPLLKTGLSLSLDLDSNWKETSSACIGYAKVNIENIGQKTIHVSNVKYELKTADVIYLNKNEKIKNIGTLPISSKTLEEGSFGDEFLTGGYDPKMKSNQTLSILFDPDIKEDLWIYVTVYGDNNERIDYWYDIVPPCTKEDDK